MPKYPLIHVKYAWKILKSIRRSCKHLVIQIYQRGNDHLAWDETISAATPLHCLAMTLLIQLSYIRFVFHVIRCLRAMILSRPLCIFNLIWECWNFTFMSLYMAKALKTSCLKVISQGSCGLNETKTIIPSYFFVTFWIDYSESWNKSNDPWILEAIIKLWKVLNKFQHVFTIFTFFLRLICFYSCP